MAEGWVSEEETSADKLSAAIQGGNENEFIRLLKSETSDLQNFRDSRGLSPLHVAVMSKKNRMVGTLLQYRHVLKLNIDIRSAQDSSQGGSTALEFAVLHHNRKALRMLVKHGSDVRPLMEKRKSKMKVCSRIRDIAYPRPCSPAPAFTNPPQSLRETDFANLVPDVPPKLLVGLLLSSKSIIRYKPAWSTDDRFCFPSYLQPCLPDNTWQNLDKYAIVAGRFLTPVRGKMKRSAIHQLLVQVFEDIGECMCPHVSQTSFLFSSDIMECLVTFTRNGSKKGIMICVRSKQFTISSMTQCSDAMTYVMELTQLLVGKSLDCAVVSTRDLQANIPEPHVYSTTEVAKARRREEVFLIHPADGVKESFCALLLEDGEHSLQKHSQVTQNKSLTQNVVTGTCSVEQKEIHSKRELHCSTAEWTYEEIQAKRKLHCSTGEWSYEVYDTAVQRCCRDLTQFMNPSILLPTLVEAGHLTLEEAAEIIKSPAGHSDHCMLLLANVARKGRGAYSALFQALKDDSQHKPHHELWETLVQKCEDIAASGMQEESLNPEWMCAGDHESSLTPTFGYSYGSSGNHSAPGRRSLSFCASDASHTTSVDSGFHTQSQNRPTSMSPQEVTAIRQNMRAVDFGTQTTKADSLIPPLHTKVGQQKSKHLQLVSTIPPRCDSMPKKHDLQASMYSFLSVKHLKSEHDDILQQNFDMNELYQPPQRQLFTISDHEEDSDTELDPSCMKLSADHKVESRLIKDSRNVSSASLLIASPSIKVPSRNTSLASLQVASPTNAPSRNGSATTLPVAKLPYSRRQSSSSDSSNSSSSPPSSNSSISYLSLSPSNTCNSIKDLSAIPPKQQSLLTIVRSSFKKLTWKLSTVTASTEDITPEYIPASTEDTTPEYIPGFGFKM